jgi:ribosome-binding protein aMBF1 (putative translation factor)
VNTKTRSPAEVGRIIRAAREDLGMTRRELAAALYRCPASVNAWERGAYHPPRTVTARLAEVLDIDPAALRR